MPVKILQPGSIFNHASAIRNSDPFTQKPIQHDTVKWKNKLAKNPQTSQAWHECMKFLNGKLSLDRSILLNAVDQGVQPQTRFLMQMIWGNVPTDGRAPGKILKYFSSPQINSNYNSIIQKINQKNLDGAFSDLCKVPGLSTSFATKVLYFETRSLPQYKGKYALIMDNRVSSGIVKATSPWAYASVNSDTPRPNVPSGASAIKQNRQTGNAWDKYWSYVVGCHDIGRILGIEPDFVEYFLFNY